MNKKMWKLIVVLSVVCVSGSWAADFASLEVIENRPGVTYNDIAIGDGNASLANNEIGVAAWTVIGATGIGDTYLLSRSTGSWALSNTCQSGMTGKKFVAIAIGEVDAGNVGAEVVTVANDAAEEYNFSVATPGWKNIVMMAPANGYFTDGTIGEVSNNQIGNEVVLTSGNTAGVGGGGLFSINYDAPIHVDGSAKSGWYAGAVSGQQGHANKGYQAVSIGDAKSGAAGNEIVVVTNEPGAGVFEIHNMQLGIGGVGDYAGGVIGMPAGKALWTAEVGNIDASRTGNEITVGSLMNGAGGNLEILNYDNALGWVDDVAPSAGVIKNNTVATGILGNDLFMSEVIGGINDFVIRWKDAGSVWQYKVLESGLGSYSAVAIGDVNGDLLNDVVFARSSGVLGVYTSVPEPATVCLLAFGSMAFLGKKRRSL